MPKIDTICNIDLRCFVVTQFLSRIYALFWRTFYRPKKYGGVPKMTNMRYADALDCDAGLVNVWLYLYLYLGCICICIWAVFVFVMQVWCMFGLYRAPFDQWGGSGGGGGATNLEMSR